MSWLAIGAEGLIIVAIIIWLIIKRRAIGKLDEDSDNSAEDPGRPNVDLPDEEKWE